MLRQEEIASIKAISTLQLSPAILKELRKALSRRKKKPLVIAGIRSTTSRNGGQSPPPPKSTESSSGQAQSQRASNLGRLVGAHQQAPSTWRWVRVSVGECIGSHGRTRCIMQPATSVPRGSDDVRGCPGRRPASAKWVVQTHSHGFNPV